MIKKPRAALAHRMVEMGIWNRSLTVWKVCPRDTQSAACRSSVSERRMRRPPPTAPASTSEVAVVVVGIR